MAEPHASEAAVRQVESDISRVEGEITRVEQQIADALAKVAELGGPGEGSAVNFFMAELERLRKKEEQLRKEKEQIREMWLLYERQRMAAQQRAYGAEETAGGQAEGWAQGSPGDRTDDYVLHELLPRLPEDPPAFGDLGRMFNEGLLRGDNALRLPVAAPLYQSLTIEHSSLESLIEVDSRSHARALSDDVSSVLRHPMSAESDEITLAGFVDRCMVPFSDLVFRHRAVSVVRYRNSTEDSVTKRSKRPDLIWLVNGTLLFKGEDKTFYRQMAAAKEDLLSKLKEWSSNYHGKMEYLLCYAAAGSCIQFCALRRDDKHRVYNLGPECDLRTVRGALMCMERAILVGGILSVQRPQLPPSFLWLGSVDRRAGSTITWFDGYVEKLVENVDSARINALNQLYCDLLGKPHIIQGTLKGKRGGGYVVTLRPVGLALSRPPSSSQQLLRALRCIFSALEALHAARYGHGDLRWPNVIEFPPGSMEYVLIDIDGAVELGTICYEPFPLAWKDGSVLDEGVYTAASDLRQVGHMVCEGDVAKELGQALIQGHIASLQAAVGVVDAALKALS